MDLFECSVCFNDMLERTPRFLKCHHSFCTECLEKMRKNNKIQCPNCREITELNSNDVTELKVNFLLHKMKEIAVLPGDKETRSQCQSCKSTEALHFCHTCPKMLCLPCKIKHNRIGTFKEHVVNDLCQAHLDGITHMCSHCVLPLCTQCMLHEHIFHEAHFVTFNEGINDILQQAELLHGKLKTEAEYAGKELKINQNSDNHMSNMINTFEEHAAIHETKAGEIRRRIGEVKQKRDKFASLKHSITEGITECSTTAEDLCNLKNNQLDICKRYRELKMKAQKSIESIKNISFRELKPQFEPATSCSCEIIRVTQTETVHEVRDIKLSKLVLQLKDTQDIKCRSQAVCLGNDVLFVNCSNRNHIVRLNLKGQVVDRYYPSQDADINGVSCFENRVYIIQTDAITVIPVTTKKPVVVYSPQTDGISKILVKDSNTLFISNDKKKPNGKIYKYQVDQDATTVMVSGLDDPWYMSLIQSKDGDKYVLNEYETRRIHVYDESWRLLHSFGRPGKGEGEFSSVYATAVTDMDTLLIADYGNNRIAHYTVDGCFQSYVLTDTDGLQSPVALAYNKPYLWVYLGYPALHVKCFKLE